MAGRSFLLESPEILLGIGPERTDAMAAAGMHTIADMFDRGPRAAHRAAPSLGAREIGEWFCQAMLLQVKDVTPHLADAFVRAGITSVKALAEARLTDVETAARDAHDAGRLSDMPTVYDVADLQQAAWKVLGTGMVAGRLLRAGGGPDAGIAGAAVEVADRETKTDDDGRFALVRVRTGSHRIRVELDDRPDPFRSGAVVVRAGRLVGPRTLRIPGPLPLQTLEVREGAGALVWPTAGDRKVIRERPLADFPEGTRFHVRDTKDGKVRLLSLWRVRHGRTLVVERAWVSPGALPAGAAPDSVVRLEGGALIDTRLTKHEYELEKIRLWASHRTVRRIRRVEI